MVIKKSSIVDSFESYLLGYWEYENLIFVNKCESKAFVIFFWFLTKHNRINPERDVYEDRF